MKMESNSNLNFVGMNVTSGAGGQQFVVNPPLPPRITFVNEVQVKKIIYVSICVIKTLYQILIELLLNLTLN
jgi:uncharacterized pyridoxamine 5'-phosphate oxidase family protein